MPISYHDDLAVFTGDGTVEEALDLVEWLRARPAAAIDLAGCTHLHAALLQCLMAVRPSLASPPDDPVLARLLTPLLTAGPAPAATPDQPAQGPQSLRPRRSRSARATSRTRAS